MIPARCACSATEIAQRAPFPIRGPRKPHLTSPRRPPAGDSRFRVWDAAGGECRHDVGWESGAVSSCSFVEVGGAAGALLATCHVAQARREGRVLLWDVLQRTRGWVDGQMCAPAVSLDGFVGRITALDACCPAGGGGALLAAACSDGTLRVYELPGASAADPASAAAAAAPRAAAAPGAATAAAAAAAGKEGNPVVLFDALLEEEEQDSLEEGAAAAQAQHRGSLPPWSAGAARDAANSRNAVRFSPCGALLAASAGRRLALYDVAAGQRVLWVLSGLRGRVRCLEWAPGGELVTASEGGEVRMWRVAGLLPSADAATRG